MLASGKFITLEGSEGAGKSTNLEALCDVLTAENIDFYRTREPGGTPMAEALRDILLGQWQEDVDGMTELLMVFAARNQHLNNVIRPRLAKGQWIVSDRFTDATYAYQGIARGIPRAYVEQLEQWVQGELHPHLTLYLDLDPEVGKARIANREQDRMEQEQLEFFTAVRQGYLERAKALQRIHVIDASQPLVSVQAEVVGTVQAFINGLKT